MFWFLNSNITMEDIILRIFAVVIIILLILPLHEYAHGWVANKLGDPTAKYSGRMTLNPAFHIDPLGSIGILLFGFGWAKPVPIDPRYFKNPKRDMAITALAGPVSNILAAIVGGLLINLIFLFNSSISQSLLYGLVIFFQYYISINIGLAVFNMIPIPPLDGSKILAAFIPDRILYKFTQYQNIIILLLFVLIFIGFLSVPLTFAQMYVYKFVMWLTSLPFISFK